MAELVSASVTGMKARKSTTVAVLLAALPGMIGFLGVGHFYVRRFKRGAWYLIGGLSLLGGGLILGCIAAALGMTVPPPGYEPVQPPSYQGDLAVAGFFLVLGFPVLWVVQILDARGACRRHNAEASAANESAGVSE